MEDPTALSGSQTINLIVGLVVFLFIFFIALNRIDKVIKINAVDGCMKSSKYEKEFPDQNSKITSPMNDLYKTCLKDKGY